MIAKYKVILIRNMIKRWYVVGKFNQETSDVIIIITPKIKNCK